MPAKADQLAEKLEAIVRSLPEASFDWNGPHAAMRVAKKNFGWFMNSHHGDGIIGFSCKVLPGEAEILLKDTTRFYRPAYTPKGWVGRRLDTPRVSWTEVRELVNGSYRLIAPARLVRTLDTKPSA